jgi:hypothetical protein
MHYNTTTIPTTMYNTIHTFTEANFFISMISGMVAILPFWIGIGFMLYNHQADKNISDDSEDGDGEDEEEKEEKYMEEFKALADFEINFSELKNKMVRETIDREIVNSTDENIKSFDIILTYDKETETFWYYTDILKEVSYDILETVARKFAIEHNCKRLYVQKAEEKEESDEADKIENGGEACEAGGAEPPVEPPSVFAKFKKYNNGTRGIGGLPIFNKEIVEPTNHFRYKGKLYNYEEVLKKKAGEEKNINPELDYAAYKLLMQAKKEN